MEVFHLQWRRENIPNFNRGGYKLAQGRIKEHIKGGERREKRLC